MSTVYLTHHGVKGMHWGVIKDSSKAFKSGSRIAGTMAKNQKANQQYDYSEIKKMSDKELQQRINRINMERTYASLTQPKVKSGAEKAKEVLEVAGEIAVIVGTVGTLYDKFKK